jgi:hypothetical protein
MVYQTTRRSLLSLRTRGAYFGLFSAGKDQVGRRENNRQDGKEIFN